MAEDGGALGGAGADYASFSFDDKMRIYYSASRPARARVAAVPVPRARPGLYAAGAIAPRATRPAHRC